MKATVILKGFSDQYLSTLESMPARELFDKLNKLCHEKRVTMKIGTGQFRDRVELNQLIRCPYNVTAKIEPRRGYKLATFEFTRDPIGTKTP